MRAASYRCMESPKVLKPRQKGYAHHVRPASVHDAAPAQCVPRPCVRAMSVSSQRRHTSSLAVKQSNASHHSRIQSSVGSSANQEQQREPQLLFAASRCSRLGKQSAATGATCAHSAAVMPARRAGHIAHAEVHRIKTRELVGNCAPMPVGRE